MAGRGKNRDDRAAQERARIYAARREYHAGLGRRRTRDNVIAALGGGLLILGILGAQTAYFTVGPGAPEPVPTETPLPTPTDGATDAPTSPSPTSSPTP